MARVRRGRACILKKQPNLHGFPPPAFFSHSAGPQLRTYAPVHTQGGVGVGLATLLYGTRGCGGLALSVSTRRESRAVAGHAMTNVRGVAASGLVFRHYSC